MTTPVQLYRREQKLSPIERFGKPIWTALFEVSVPLRDTMSPAYVRLFGMPTVGDEDIDKSMHDQPIITYMSIDKMVEHFKRGIAVKVLRHADTKTIYEIINNYLLAWKDNLEHGINIGDAPIEDLILLDRFTDVVYQHAVHHFTREYINSRFVQGISGGGMWKSRDSLVKSDPVAEEVAQPQRRESLSTLFSERIIRGGHRPAPATPPAGEATPPTAPRWMRGRER